MRKWLSVLLCGLLMMSMAATASAGQLMEATVIDSSNVAGIFDYEAWSDMEAKDFVEDEMLRALITTMLSVDFIGHFESREEADAVFPVLEALLNEPVIGANVDGIDIVAMYYMDGYMLVALYSIDEAYLGVFVTDCDDQERADAVMEMYMEENAETYRSVSRDSVGEIADIWMEAIGEE